MSSNSDEKVLESGVENSKEQLVKEEANTKKEKLNSRAKNQSINKISDEDLENSEYELMYSLSFTNWLLTFLIQDIPIIGEIALLFWSFSRKQPVGKKHYARARLIYKLIFDALAIITIYLLYVVGMQVLQGVIQYMEML